jgi:hypothetical protein
MHAPETPRRGTRQVHFGPGVEESVSRTPLSIVIVKGGFFLDILRVPENRSRVSLKTVITAFGHTSRQRGCELRIAGKRHT